MTWTFLYGAPFLIEKETNLVESSFIHSGVFKTKINVSKHRTTSSPQAESRDQPCEMFNVQQAKWSSRKLYSLLSFTHLLSI
jgi:hypothetical protein